MKTGWTDRSVDHQDAFGQLTAGFVYHAVFLRLSVLSGRQGFITMQVMTKPSSPSGKEYSRSLDAQPLVLSI